MWIAVHQSSLTALKPLVERTGLPWLWDPVIVRLLEQPTWLVFGVVGILLMLIGRKKKPLIGYAR
jgi:hypothetical protein